MPALTLHPIESPLRSDESGVVRVGDTRVTLDSLIGCYFDGASAEEIAEQYPSLALSDVHAAIAYYLTHRAEVDAYLDDRRRDAAEVRRRVAEVCDQRGLRERLLARQAASKRQP